MNTSPSTQQRTPERPTLCDIMAVVWAVFDENNLLSDEGKAKTEKDKTEIERLVLNKLQQLDDPQVGELDIDQLDLFSQSPPQKPQKVVKSRPICTSPYDFIETVFSVFEEQNLLSKSFVEEDEFIRGHEQELQGFYVTDELGRRYPTLLREIVL